MRITLLLLLFREVVLLLSGPDVECGLTGEASVTAGPLSKLLVLLIVSLLVLLVTMVRLFVVVLLGFLIVLLLLFASLLAVSLNVSLVVLLALLFGVLLGCLGSESLCEVSVVEGKLFWVLRASECVEIIEVTCVVAVSLLRLVGVDILSEVLI